jgi:hypothetical protein
MSAPHQIGAAVSLSRAESRWIEFYHTTKEVGKGHNDPKKGGLPVHWLSKNGRAMPFAGVLATSAKYAWSLAEKPL